MKLKLEITNVDQQAGTLTLKPIDCALWGELLYRVPRRAAEMCRTGDVVEASIPLPDQYPINAGPDPMQPTGQDWQPVETAPAGVWLLVSAGEVISPGGAEIVIARLEKTTSYGRTWHPMFSRGVYHGAKYWRPLPLVDCYRIPTPDNGSYLSDEALETRVLDEKWYKRLDYFPHNWEPLQCEIASALERVMITGQPQVINRCGYVNTEAEFIPYKRVFDTVAPAVTEPEKPRHDKHKKRG